MHPVNIPAKSKVRSIIRSWDNRMYSTKLGSPCIRPRSIFSQIFNWFLFGWTLWIYLPNLTFVALPVPEIIGGTQKIGQSLDMPTFHFLPNFLIGFCSHGPSEYICRIWRLVALPIPEIIGGTSKIWGVPGFAHPLYSPKFLKGFCLHWPCEYTCQVWSS